MDLLSCLCCIIFFLIKKRQQVLQVKNRNTCIYIFIWKNIEKIMKRHIKVSYLKYIYELTRFHWSNDSRSKGFINTKYPYTNIIIECITDNYWQYYWQI